MKNLKRALPLVFILFCAIISCHSNSTPQQYFERTVMQTNKFRLFGNVYFKKLQRTKPEALPIFVDGQMIVGAHNYVEFIEKYELYRLNKNIDTIKALQPTSETRNMIRTSLNLFEQLQHIYKNEYVNIAGLIDNNAPQDTIDKAIETMEMKYFPTINELYIKVMDVGLPYAIHNNIKTRLPH